MKWTFAKNDGGRDSGFHDAGVETFKGNFDRYLARELIQNSLDARLDINKPVKIVFSLLEMKREDMPDIDNLRVAFDRSKEYWSHDKKAVSFFEKASDLAHRESISMLRISDFNTSGVLGSDTDREKNWYNLIRSAGSSSKGGGEGGSFGIGKNAPFAASKMRTVFYSTYNTDKEHIFQGVAMLVSHNGSDGSVVQPVGYLGAENGHSVRKKDLVPKAFLRNEFGTDITVVGFDARENWRDQLIYSVLDNFWLAIEFGQLEVVVGDEHITKQNLSDLLRKFGSEFDDGEFTAHLYYDAYTNPSHPTLNFELPHLKAVNLYLKIGDSDLPKRVVMVRKTGMKIFEKAFRSIVPFCGVFVCSNDVGNQKLRDMEPPRHDVWDPDYPDKGVNRKIENEYVSFIRSCVKQLTPIDNADVISLPGLNRYLPDDDESFDTSFDSSDTPVTSETFERNMLPEKITGQVVDRKKQKMQPDNSHSTIYGDSVTDQGEGDSFVVREGRGSNNNDGGDQTGSGNGNPNEAEVTKGRSGGTNSKPAIPIKYRTFVINPRSGVYRISVKPEKELINKVDLFVWLVGDDQKTQAEILSARFASGEEIRIKNDCILDSVSLPPSGTVIEVVLKSPRRVAMEVIAHETL